jgi:DNA-binding transcriptional LysR family regulator
MDAAEIADLMVLAAVAERQSFRGAALALGVSPSAVSHRIRALEERLGVRVLHRTTRSVAPTAAGERLLARLRPAFAAIETAIEEVGAERHVPAGPLRLNAPHLIVDLVLAPMIRPFLDAYPDIRLEIAGNDGLIDIVAAGFDAGIRFGERLQRDMAAVALGPAQRDAIVASPAYFAQRPPPSTPHDLRAHACIRFRFASGALYLWAFERDGESIAIDVEGPLTLDNPHAVLRAALDGVGIATTLESLARPLVAEGRLVRVLADWCAPYPGLFLYYPSNRRVPPALRAFIDFARRQPTMLG